MNLSVVIPIYNNEEILAENLPKVLESIEGYDQGKVELIITDDSSSDKSLDISKSFATNHKSSKVNVKIVESTRKVNSGFSSNVNRGVGESSGELVILLNSDVIPAKDFWRPLIEHFSDKNVFAVGVKEESTENGNNILRGRGVGKWKRGFMVHSAGNLEKSDTLWVSGGSGIFRKDLWNKLGGLDVLYNPFYWEDIDLSYRARKSGYLTLFDNKSIVRHNHDRGIIRTKFSAGNIKKIAYRNQFIFAWKNSDWINLAQNILWLPYHILTALLRRDFIFIYGFFAALIIMPKIVLSRIRAQKGFILSDLQTTKTQ